MSDDKFEAALDKKLIEAGDDRCGECGYHSAMKLDELARWARDYTLREDPVVLALVRANEHQVGLAMHCYGSIEDAPVLDQAVLKMAEQALAAWKERVK